MAAPAGDPAAGTAPLRVVAVWCPDWPVVAGAAAQGLPAEVPAAVLAANRVLAGSAAARAHGVRRGQRRREAQSRCPELAVLADDPDRDARAFEPVAVAVEALAPGVEVLRPGLVVVPARGPVRYFGGEPAVAERLIDLVAAQTGVRCQVGIADGLFAATLAAHRGLLVAPQGSPAFLAGLGIGELHHQPTGTGAGRAAPDRAGADRPGDDRTGTGRAALVDLLHRLGLRTLGAFAALPVDDVASRFGPDGVRAHRLAAGLDERPPARRRPPVDLTVTRRLDPPVDRVDAAAFASREPAEQLHAALAARGLACIRLGVSARTEAGEELHRVWRCAEPLTASGIADRVRWQLDGWLSARGPRPSAGLTLLRLIPEEVLSGQALQRGLWGEAGEADERAGRALVRVQGMLGPDAVLTGVLGGGRGPADRVRLVPWGEDRAAQRATEDPLAGSSISAEDPLAGSSISAEDPLAGSSISAGSPWPGRLPAPSPSRVFDCPRPAEVLDDTGRVVGVSGRGVLTGVPYRVAVEGRPPRRVLSWAGPWPVEQRWWEPGGGQRCARLQVVLDAEPGSRAGAEPGTRTGAEPGSRTGEPGPLALLLTRTEGSWRVEGRYE